MKTQLDYVYDHEKNRSNDIWFTQPMGQNKVIDISFGESMTEVRKMAQHLKNLNLPTGSRIALFSKNTAWWFMADLAIWMAGHITVPIYPTLAPNSIKQILDHSGSVVIFIGKLDGWENMEPGIPASVKRIIMPLGPKTTGETWENIIKTTQAMKESPSPAPDAIATLMYTSGSTGVPKGVVHSFRTMCSAKVYVDEFKMKKDDRIISYLPLAHTAERTCVETTNFMVGYHLYFAESLDTFIQDIQRARPTVFGSVPRLWVKFQAGVFQKLPPKKFATLKRIPIIGSLIKKKVLKGLGFDQVRLAVSGSAPIPVELLDWYRDLGIHIREVYGMTENFAISHVVGGDDYKPGYVGKPLPGVPQKIAENGEILIKTPGLMLGYYNAPDKTAETMTEDGWLKTGDRGEIDSEGRLKITGRVKELFKTSKGKYVSPAPIENLIMACPEVDQVCVMGAGMPQPMAIIVLSPVGKETKGQSIKVVIDEVNGQLDQHEQLAKVVIVSDEWTIDNGMLTPTLKLKRNSVEEKYNKMVPDWYRHTEMVIHL